jgi:hypothetical protein
MKSLGLTLIAALGLLAGSMAHAQGTPPAGSTGLCKDGTYTNHTTKRGACSGHKGVQTWFETAAAPATAPAATAATPAAPAPAAPAPAAKAKTRTPPAPAATAAPGGGAGKVWVNTGSSSKAYHCAGDRWYGKTKAGEYMTAAEAEAKGYHAARGKACAAQ